MFSQISFLLIVLILQTLIQSFFFLSHVKNGVDAKELFHLYIMIWIQDKRMSLLETCKMDTVCTLFFKILTFLVFQIL